MAEETNIILDTQENALGKIQMAPEVVEVILGIAASKIDGVHQMRGTLSSSINELFGRSNHGKGVTLKVVDGKVSADVYAYLNYGVSVPKVALAMQEALKEQLLFMTDLDLAEVNVHVVGVITEKTPKIIDPDDLFNEATPDQNGEQV
ncbi:Asp23/Gls24 family envelope stress response protein [Latilactobacillus graminis]|nr:Asp23/Gls24 family envelope stress response protein [Latilactobacillus graminis]QFP79878.1 Asp23/Gls24 family envelope stress response protein [Latilactobacillus graminis]